MQQQLCQGIPLPAGCAPDVNMALSQSFSTLRSGVLQHLRLTAGSSCLQTLGVQSLGLVRGFAEQGTFLDKGEVTDRVVGVVKNFDKVDPSKVGQSATPAGHLCLRPAPAIKAAAHACLYLSTVGGSEHPPNSYTVGRATQPPCLRMLAAGPAAHMWQDPLPQHRVQLLSVAALPKPELCAHHSPHRPCVSPSVSRHSTWLNLH